MTRAFDDVLSSSLFRPRPSAELIVHVMRDENFAPNGIALEVAPAGIPHVVVDDRRRKEPLVLHWALDARSHLEPGEELHIETKPYGPDLEEEGLLCRDLGPRVWCGWLAPDAVEIQDLRDEVRVVIDPRDLPHHDAWRVAWGYDLVLVSHRLVAERLDPWLVIETPAPQPQAPR